MLTLTRKVGEKILIGENIEIVVKEIRGNQVRLGVEAPREIGIMRPEVARQRICARCHAVGRWTRVHNGQSLCASCYVMIMSVRSR